MAGEITSAGVSRFTPDGFMFRATGEGFLVAVSYLGQDAIKSLILTKWVEQAGWVEAAFRREGHFLLDMVPRIGGQQAGEGLDFKFARLPGKKIPVIEVRLTLKAIEPSFLESVAKLANEKSAQARRAAEIDIRFDAKVQEEVENDPEILALREAANQAKTKAAEVETALLQRRSELLEEREARRGSFHFVVEGREI
jgi:hypothetical protein